MAKAGLGAGYQQTCAQLAGVAGMFAAADGLDPVLQ
jgi:hypothetical protein